MVTWVVEFLIFFGLWLLNILALLVGFAIGECIGLNRVFNQPHLSILLLLGELVRLELVVEYSVDLLQNLLLLVGSHALKDLVQVLVLSASEYFYLEVDFGDELLQVLLLLLELREAMLELELIGKRVQNAILVQLLQGVDVQAQDDLLFGLGIAEKFLVLNLHFVFLN